MEDSIKMNLEPFRAGTVVECEGLPSPCIITDMRLNEESSLVRTLARTSVQVISVRVDLELFSDSQLTDPIWKLDAHNPEPFLVGDCAYNLSQYDLSTYFGSAYVRVSLYRNILEDERSRNAQGQ